MCRVQGLAAQAGVGGAKAAGGALLDPAIEAFEVRRYMYMYIYIHICVYVYIYLYTCILSVYI